MELDINKVVSDLKKELNYNPWFFLKWRTRHLQRQIEYTTAQTQKVTAWTTCQQELALAKERFDNALAVERKTFEGNIEAAIAKVEAEKLNQKLLQMCQELGIDLVNLGLVRKEQLIMEVHVERTRRESEIKVQEHLQFAEIDDDMDERKTNRALRAALAYQNLNWPSAVEILKALTALKEKRFELQYSGKPIQLIEDQLKDYNRHIKALEAEHERLIQGDSRKEVSGGDADTDSRADNRKALAGPQEQAPDSDDRDE